MTFLLVKLLLERDADIEAKDDSGCGALHLLCRYHGTNTLRHIILFLTNKGIDINACNSTGYNAFHILCRYQASNNLENVVRIFVKAGIDVNAKGPNGSTALHFLCRNYPNEDLKRIIQLLVEHKVDVKTTNADKWSSLHFLCRYYPNDDLVEIVQLLIDNGADITQKNASGMNALDCCLLNPSGEFHALFDFIKKQKGLLFFNSVLPAKSQLFGVAKSKFVCRAESQLDMAKLGCIDSVKWLIEPNAEYCIDIHGKNSVHYLKEVWRNFWVTCRICRNNNCYSNPSMALEKLERDLRLDSKKPFQLPKIPLLNIQDLEKKITVCSDFAVFKEKTLVVLPHFDCWETLVRSWHSNNPDFRGIERYVRQHSHFQCNTGLSCSWCRVSHDIKMYLKALTEEIGNLDRRLESSQLIDYGSSAEGSKIFLPDEFDYAVLLRNFQSYIKERSFDVSYVGRPEDAQVFLGTDRRSVSSGRLLLYYGYLMEQAVGRIPWRGNIFQTRVTISETCVTLIFHHRSREIQEPHQVSVDLTIAVMANGIVFFPADRKELPGWCRLVNNNVKQEYLVPQRNSGGKSSQWQLSTFTLERDTFLHSDRRTVTHVFRLLKILAFLHQAQPDQRRLSRQTIPSSYALKTCLFTYMKDVPPPWSDKDLIRHCKGVLDCFPTHSKEQGLLSFFSDYTVVYHISYSSRKAVNEINDKLSRCAF